MKGKSFKNLMLSMALSVASLNAFADTLALTPNHPDEYKVVKGDTLWDISAKFLKDPWRWPSLWEMNQQVKNPHWIYPGDILYLTYENGKPVLKVKRDGSKENNGVVKLSPSVYETNLEDKILTIPYNKVKQFLTSPKIVSGDELDNSPYIVGYVEQRLLISTNDQFFAMEIPEQNDREFYIYHAGDIYRDPETQEILGYEAQWIGGADMVTYGNPSVLKVTEVKKEINKGDRLIAKPAAPDLDFLPRSPDAKIDATIIKVLDSVSKLGQYNVVVLNKGEKEGLQPGHVLTVYQQDKSVIDPYTKHVSSNSDLMGNEVANLPGQKSGSLMVFRVFDHLSYGLVMTSDRYMSVLDHARTPE